ncbi:Hypothetical protein R9X50_00004300 [Acrodontium crateriforme]|uniref:Ankyrin repeat protein n=1 Tax=Acrodontium crateriforme TaxID=150365 RepID=A0AAQ3R6T5_9PEZI|nr:Hypothetical protein R9X50_00004300 [Acrodontium crateriforme]
MSFGFSIGDFVEAGKLVKKTLDNIKSAPADFREAEKTVQSLDILLDSVQSEVNSPTSVFRRDPAQAEQFCHLIRSCEGPLAKLNVILTKFPSLGSEKAKVLDRARFSKKAVLEIRGEIALRYQNLSAFLDTIGLGTLGRLENKVDFIRDVQFSILEAVDRAVAEARLKRNTASYLSDHSNDDKAVWKQLRRDLNKAGFKSSDLERHKVAICTKLKELQDYGLLDWDDASVATNDNESVVTFIAHPKVGYKPPAVKTVYEGSEVGGDAEFVLPQSQIWDDEKEQPPPYCPFIIWKGRRGNINLKGRILKATVEHVYIETPEKEEILLPLSNLTDAELEYISNWRRLDSLRVPRKDSSTPLSDRSSGKDDRKHSAQASASQSTFSGTASHPDYDTETITGWRTLRTPRWQYRGSEAIKYRPATMRGIRDDALPNAAAVGNEDKVRRLLNNGANIESTGKLSYSYTTKDSEGHETTHHVNLPETTALYRAATKGHFHVALLLLRNSANPNTDNKDGCSLLRALIESSPSRMVRLLLEFNADVNAQGVLRLAASHGRTATLRTLLEYGADIDRPNIHGETALYRAAWSGHVKCVAELLQEGAKVSILTKDGQSALYKAAGQGHDAAVDLLLKYGAAPDVGMGKAGETVLYKACRLGHERTVRLLLRRGANPDAENEFRPTDYGSKSELLMHFLRPTEPAKNEYGLRPLYAAARLGHADIVRALLEYGADINARTENGVPAVYIAAEMGHKDVVELLLTSGAQLVDRRFIDPVARYMSNDEHESILPFSDEENHIEGVGTKTKTKTHADAGDRLKKNNLPDNKLLSIFKDKSLREGGDGLKTMAKMLGLQANQGLDPAALPFLALAGAGLLGGLGKVKE